ncbi:MAG TPA: 2-dehydropantoate 2-reductase N-terminal domain-containing protein [Kofleriaceae bacterium]|nr:2-dehydropantoate 2-reductase N-terminal domain-containing protein [Kofleriaceae bacterium]
MAPRFVIYGAGAVGGAIGGRLAARGADVVLIARGAHAAALRDRGLSIVTPAGTATAGPPVVEHPRELAWTGDEVVILAMKSQDTVPALDALTACAPPAIEVVCAQNGIANERAALRRFARVAAMYVWIPAELAAPGVVRIYGAARDGIVDVGCYPRGTDAGIAAIAAAFDGTPFESAPRADIMAWKHRKLLTNLGNAVDAACGGVTTDAACELVERARAEGAVAFAAAGLPVISLEEETARRGDRFPHGAIDGARRRGGSSWQSLARGAGTIEADYLNGEIVLLGRLHGVATPVNELLQRTANEQARARRPPGTVDAAELLRRLG